MIPEELKNHDVVCPYCGADVTLDGHGCMHTWCKHVDLAKRKQGFVVPLKQYKNGARITELYKELHDLEAEVITEQTKEPADKATSE